MNRQFLDELYRKYFNAKTLAERFDAVEAAKTNTNNTHNCVYANVLSEIIDDYIKMHGGKNG